MSVTPSMISRSGRETTNPCRSTSADQTAVVDDDRRRWDDRYRAAPPAVAAEPDALSSRPDLRELVPSDGLAVDVACGSGPTTLWLARRGLAVRALDVSPLAIGLVERAATIAQVDDRVAARVVDLDDGLPSDLHDIDVIVCQRFRDPALYPSFVERLRVGGIAIVTVLSEVGLTTTPGAFHAPAGELFRAFDRPDTEVLHSIEAGGTASIVCRRSTG